MDIEQERRQNDETRAMRRGEESVEEGVKLGKAGDVQRPMRRARVKKLQDGSGSGLHRPSRRVQRRRCKVRRGPAHLTEA